MFKNFEVASKASSKLNCMIAKQTFLFVIEKLMRCRTNLKGLGVRN